MNPRLASALAAELVYCEIVLSVTFRYSALRLPRVLSALVTLCVFGCTFPGYRLDPEAAGGTDGAAGRGGGGTESGGTSAGVENGGGTAGTAGGAGVGDGGRATMGSIRIGLAASAYSIVQEQSSYDPTHVDQCQADQVVIGFRGTVDAPGGETHLKSVQAICGETSVGGTGQYEVTITQTSTLPVHNAAAEVVQTVLCPSNQLVTSFTGRAGGYIDAIDIRCAALRLVGAPPSLVLIVGNSSKAGTMGGATGGSNFELVQCNDGDIGVGQVVRTAGSTAPIAGFGIRCSTPSLQED